MSRSLTFGLLCVILGCHGGAAADDQVAVEVRTTPRPPAGTQELQDWLTNMVGYHRYTLDEVSEATGLPSEAIARALDEYDIVPGRALPGEERLFVLPYPGGRHPRIGFLDGAVDPQRETKVSIFTPWHDPEGDRADYVVVDVPEAIWSNLGLTYLAHTHVPTIWTERDAAMQPLEWKRGEDNSLTHSRTLPNGIAFTSTVSPQSDHVRMQMQLTNGTEQELSGLRVQMCVMLKGAAGFDQQTSDNKLLKAPYAAVHAPAGNRWIITAWLPNQRTWANPRCPCLHSDPQFPDCPPGESRSIDGWLSFYEGTDIDGELERIQETQWWNKP